MDTPLDQATRLLETERAQIGHEIHDALLPLIFAASAGVTRVLESPRELSPQDRDARLRQVASLLQDALQTGRRLLSEVYPPELTDQGWTAIARDTLERLFPQRASSIQWRLDPSVDELSDPVAAAAYRIVIEAVRNAYRHGNASQVAVVGERPAGGLRITVRDDGSGFDPADVPADRFGVRSMRGRAELAGGSLHLQSKPGGPTSVVFAVEPHSNTPSASPSTPSE